jgi:hypothetical protein
MVDVCAEGKSPVSWTTGGNCDRARSQWNRLAVVEPPWAVAAGANQCNVDHGDRRLTIYADVRVRKGLASAHQ